jgi:hypothetical protein
MEQPADSPRAASASPPSATPTVWPPTWSAPAACPAPATSLRRRVLHPRRLGSTRRSRRAAAHRGDRVLGNTISRSRWPTRATRARPPVRP